MSEAPARAAGRIRPISHIPDAVWGPIAVGAELLAVGLVGLAAGQPWLFPSLGPTAFLRRRVVPNPPD